MNADALPSWGPSFLAAGRVRFRLWAPRSRSVRLRLTANDLTMAPIGDGWFECVSAEATPGDTYMFAADGGNARPDPAARAQRDDVHGPSILVDPHRYRWACPDWSGRPWQEAVIYELHVGTFTEEGTFAAAARRLDHLVALGVTAIELMPIAQFSGERGWGYDGVLAYCPHRAYGSPDDLKALVDTAHARGLMVLLDVVYNHFGPDGNYLPELAPDFFDPHRATPWGAGIDYAAPAVRAFFKENALYWLEEFRFDGLRLDAIDQITDPSAEPILEEIARTVRARLPGRRIHLTTEDNRNIVALHQRDESGKVTLYDGEWNDDFHNAVHVIATGETDGYYTDFADGRWRKFARALAEGFCYQGEYSHYRDDHRGEPTDDLPPVAFISFLQNHDQVGNRAMGERLVSLTDPIALEVLTAALLLSPHIPLLFMGEEWGETRPFLFFTDFHGELAEAVRTGRRQEFAKFAAFAEAGSRAAIPDPNAIETFEKSKLDWGHAEAADGRDWLERYRHLLSLRHRHIVPRLSESRSRAGTILCVEDGFCAVAWQLGGARLSMSINLSDAARPEASATDPVLFTTAKTGDHRLPPPGITVRLGGVDG